MLPIKKKKKSTRITIRISGDKTRVALGKA